MMPPMAMKTPKTLLSPTLLPDVIHPRATIEQVLRCPTTVDETGPVCAMMKNCDMLMSAAKSPDCNGMLAISLITTQMRNLVLCIACASYSRVHARTRSSPVHHSK